MTMSGGGSLLVIHSDAFTTLSGLLQVHRPSLKLTKLFGTDKWGWGDTASFHRCCDGKGPTITIVQRSDGLCYGGYASQSWTSIDNWVQDPNTFLFRFHKDAQQMHTKVEKYNSIGGNALRCGAPYGPIFGYQNDFFTFGSGGSMLQDNSARGGGSAFGLHTPLIDSTVTKDAAHFQLEVLQVGMIDNAELMEPWHAGYSWLPEVCKLNQTTSYYRSAGCLQDHT